MMTTLRLVWLALLPFVVAVAPIETSGAPPPAVCPAGGENTPRIAALVTGQAVTEGATTTLRFSSDVRACGEWSNEVRGSECFDRWSFHITIPNEILAPGAYELAGVGATFGDLSVKTSPHPGCSHDCRMAIAGTGSTSLEASPAKLVIESADDGCITGTISDLRSPHIDAPDYNGAFFAVRCAP